VSGMQKYFFKKNAIVFSPTLVKFLYSECCSVMKNLQRLMQAYQPPANSTFLSEQTSHQQPASSTFLSEQTNTSHQPSAKRTGR
jgi:hypothetical protein